MTSPLQERQGLATYGTGYALALLLTGAAFGLVWLHLLAPDWCLGVVLALAFAQVLPHGVYVAMNGRCFTWDNVVKNRAAGIFEPLR